MPTTLRSSTNSRLVFPAAVAAALLLALAMLAGVGAGGPWRSSIAAEPANARPAASLAASDRRQALAQGRPAAERVHAWEHPAGDDLTAALGASR